MSSNKVKYGLKNVHYAVVTETTVDGVTTSSYATPVAWNGAVHLEASPTSDDNTVFRADDSDYYIVSGSSKGFSGSFECALVPEGVETAIFDAKTDDNGVIVEYSTDEVKYVALLFEINGDTSGRRYMLPKVLFSRPPLSADTTGTDGDTPQTVTLSLTASPRPDDNLARIHTGDTTDATTYNKWFTEVYVPTFTP